MRNKYWSTRLIRSKRGSDKRRRNLDLNKIKSVPNTAKHWKPYSSVRKRDLSSLKEKRQSLWKTAPVRLTWKSRKLPNSRRSILTREKSHIKRVSKISVNFSLTSMILYANSYSKKGR